MIRGQLVVRAKLVDPVQKAQDVDFIWRSKRFGRRTCSTRCSQNETNHREYWGGVGKMAPVSGGSGRDPANWPKMADFQLSIKEAPVHLDGDGSWPPQRGCVGHSQELRRTGTGNSPCGALRAHLRILHSVSSRPPTRLDVWTVSVPHDASVRARLTGCAVHMMLEDFEFRLPAGMYLHGYNDDLEWPRTTSRRTSADRVQNQRATWGRSA